MKNLVVTGGAGFIGSNLVERLNKEGYSVISIDNYISGKEENHIPGVKYIRGDINDIEKILANCDIDVVFHLGNYSRIETSFTHIDEVWESNFIGTFRVVELCRKRNVKLVYAGSSTKFSEEGIFHSPYSFTKSVSSDIIKSYGKWYGLKYSICYFYNVFGPRYDSSPVPGYESVVSVFEKQWKHNLPLTVCGDGSQTRSFTYVGDVVDGIIRSWKYSKNEEFQLDSRSNFSIIEIAKMFGENINFLPARIGDRKKSVSLNDNAQRLLKWKPTYSIIEWIEKIKKDNENN